MNSNPNSRPPARPCSMVSFLNRARKRTVPMFAATLLGLAGDAAAQGVFDYGATAPTLGPADVSQLTGGHDNGGSYYVDSGNPGQTFTTLFRSGHDNGGSYYVDSGNPGQTFTTGANPQGYALLGIYIKTRSSGAGGGQPGLSAYTLRIYSLTNATAGTATLI